MRGCYDPWGGVLETWRRYDIETISVLYMYIYIYIYTYIYIYIYLYFHHQVSIHGLYRKNSITCIFTNNNYWPFLGDSRYKMSLMPRYAAFYCYSEQTIEKLLNCKWRGRWERYSTSAQLCTWFAFIVFCCGLVLPIYLRGPFINVD